MLDLGISNERLYEIKDKEGNVLTLMPPSQKLFSKMKGITELTEMEQLTTVYEIFRDILNLNTNGFVYDLDYVEQFDISIVSLVFKDYFEWVGEELGK